MLVREQPAHDHGRPDPSGSTVLGFLLIDRIALFIGIPALALLFGLLLPPFARWALGFSTGLPVRPVFRVLGAVDQPWEIVVDLAIWLAVGLAIAFSAYQESTTVTLTDADLRLDKGDWHQTIARADVDTVFLDGKKLVVLDRESRQLASEPHRAPGAALERAFRSHGYPWRDADPYAGLYRRWSSNTPDLPPAVNAVLAAREAALRRKAGRDIRDLREAVQKLGFGVRDEGAKQYWRPLVRS